MKNIWEILKVYGIKKAYVNNDNKLEIIIENRDSSLSLSRWINLISALKLSFNKEVEFLSRDVAMKIYGSLESFTLLGE